MREKQNLVRLFVNGRWMLLISILMTIIQWGSCGHVLDAAGLRSSFMKASLFLWLLTMPLIRLSLQRQLVLFPILLLTWCFIMWIAIFNVVFFFPFSFWQLGLGTEYFRILLQSNCGASVLDFTPQADGGPPYICLNRLNQVYGLMHRKFNMQIFTLFLLGCLVVFMSGPCQWF